jgi:hypothetical protein
MDHEIFDNWNELKKEIELNQKNIFPKHKEIWYISM